MIHEKQCPICGKYYFYDDLVDIQGVGLSSSPNSAKDGNRAKQKGECPTCVDPNALLGMSYRKSTIISLLQAHLQDSGIDTALLNEETLVGMLYQFPIAEELYYSNGTYQTVNVYPGLMFQGKYGNFLLGYSEEKVRVIQCDRCKNATSYDSHMALKFFLGFSKKQCNNCDSKAYSIPSLASRDTSGLNRNGATKKPNSNASLAKKFNVSRNDFRRYNITEVVPALQIGLIIGNLKIMEAYWDNETECPKYRLECVKCGTQFVCTQKSVYKMSHPCSKGVVTSGSNS